MVFVDRPDWVSKAADEVIERTGERKIVVASGISPSGPVHLGNVREVITGHLLADELRRRGLECDHLLSWDDFDRLRKVPAGVPDDYRQYIGMPLADIPAPPGSDKASWSEHFRYPLEAAMQQLGIQVRPIFQSQMYRQGAYNDQIITALRLRQQIQTTIMRFQSQDSEPDPNYYPYVIYCTACGKDATKITGFDNDSLELTYICACGNGQTVLISEFTNGKLPWKVDWPMRWSYEAVDFEPGGVDHCAPGSASMGVSSSLVKDVFGGQAPVSMMYAFVGVQGEAKMSSSKGNVLTPQEALSVMEPTLLRWMYARRRPNQSFTVAFDQNLHRLYDEWDALAVQVQQGQAEADATAAYVRSISTPSQASACAVTDTDGKVTEGAQTREGAARTMIELPQPEVIMPFKTLVSLIDISAGDDEQLLRICQSLNPQLQALDQLEPRLECARNWTAKFSANPTRVRTQPDSERLASLTEAQRSMLQIFLDNLEQDWSIDGLTSLVYGVPKMLVGVEGDPTPEVKALQREFFKLVYQLLISQERGPRLPTLLMAIGAERIRDLLEGA